VAVNIQASFKPKGATLLSQQTSYRRKRGKIETKKIHRKIKLKSRHILFAFLLLLGFFYGFSRLYLFLISWERLNIEEVEIICRKENIRRDLHNYLATKYMGNILLLNIDDLRQRLATHPWIEDIHIRKIFPSTIRIETKERIPIALLEKDGYFLIDKEGVLLQKIKSEDWPDLPILIDTARFRKDFDRKLALAWACLESLGDPVRKKIEVMDLSEYENVSLRFRNGGTWLKLGNSHFDEKYRAFSKNMALFESYGPLEHIDFRYEGRFVLQPLPQKKMDKVPDSEKEAF
jgi:cell division septal protein FtsQ